MNMRHFLPRLGSWTAAVALGTGLLLQAPLSFAQTAPQASGTAPSTSAPAAPAAPSTPAPAPSHAAAQPRHPRTDAEIEAHLKQLHSQLKITAAETDQWNDVAQIIRDNEHQLSQLLEQRQQQASKMNALDNLRNYEAIADAHADGLKKLVPAFEQLYDTMPAAQKKVADRVFSQQARQHSTAHATPSSSKSSTHG